MKELSFKKGLKKIVEDNSTFRGRIFDLVIQSLIIISLLSFTIETSPDLEENFLQILNYLEIGCVFIFSVEYILRIYLSENKLRFICSFYGIIDLLAILPFYVSTGIDLRSIRIFRLFRLIRIFKLFRFGKALDRFLTAFKCIKEELGIFLFATIILLYISSVGIYYFESEVQPEQFGSVFKSLWWSVATLTTVGYGDIYPVTIGGKIFTFLILMAGLGIVAVPTGLIASALTKQKDN